MPKLTKKQKELILEKNNALEGLFWSFKKRLHILNSLYLQFKLLTPYKPQPLVKSFDSFEDYEKWKKKQKNPWYW